MNAYASAKSEVRKTNAARRARNRRASPGFNARREDTALGAKTKNAAAGSDRRRNDTALGAKTRARRWASGGVASLTVGEIARGEKLSTHNLHEDGKNQVHLSQVNLHEMKSLSPKKRMTILVSVMGEEETALIDSGCSAMVIVKKGIR